MNITLDPITKKFTQLIPEEKVCYICSGNNVDEHHYDLHYGKISEETVPLCRRCHRTIHMYGGINMFDDNLLDRAIEVWNKTQTLLKRPLITRDEIVRSKYWLKKHGVKKAIIFDSINKTFTQEGASTEDNTNGSQTPIFPFHLPNGEPLCGWDWVNEHMYDLLDYSPRIEVTGPGINLAVDVKSKKEMVEVGKVLRRLRKDGNNHDKKRTITLDPVGKKFSEKE